MSDETMFRQLEDRIAARTAVAGVIGIGYVGLPLAAAAARAGYRTLAFDVDPQKVARLNRGESYIDAVGSAELAGHVASGRFEASDDFTRLAECDVIVICVPTPLTRNREPDLSFVEQTAITIARTLRPGQLVVLESTSYPGTTTGLVASTLAVAGLARGTDFFLGFSPEREDPGNQQHRTHSIPKIVSGDGPRAADLVEKFYGSIVARVVRVSTPDTAEAVKLTENIFRAVNIALVNELKIVFTRMGIDIWEVIRAASTKPFGYMPFFPGPGLGGHCIPIDPFYLTWAARAVDVSTRFIELAGEVNTAMPHYVVERLSEALDRERGLGLSRARILVIGVAYKKNVQDTRESPSLRLIDILEKRGARVEYHDPLVPVIPMTREHPSLSGRRSAALTEDALEGFDVVLIATDHDAVDYACLARSAAILVDTRNAIEARGLPMDKVVKA
jgi:UDP-N-acetyl-D-glucosamine dehydrogenase